MAKEMHYKIITIIGIILIVISFFKADEAIVKIIAMIVIIIFSILYYLVYHKKRGQNEEKIQGKEVIESNTYNKKEID